MFFVYVKMAIGAALVIFSFRLTVCNLRKVLEMILPNRKIVNNFLALIAFVASELIGVNLLIDPMVPGQALISVDASELVNKARVPAALRVEIAVANLNGSLDKEAIYRGKLSSEDGLYTALVSFDWFQSYVRVRIYETANPTTSIVEEWRHISPWARIGMSDEKVVIRQRNS